MDWENQLSVLGVCLNGLPTGSKPEALSFCATDSAQKALEMMRLMRFDLILVSPSIPDASLWNLLGKVKATCYWQKWALVAETLGERDELKARMLGCTAILEATPDWQQLDSMVNTLRRKSAVAAAQTRRAAGFAATVREPRHALAAG